MEREVTDFAKLGDALAARQDELREDSNARDEARRRLFGRPAIPGLHAPAWGRWLAVAALLGSVLLLFVVRPWQTAALTFQDVAAGHASAAVGTPLEASGDRPLLFSDGTKVTLRSGARMRVEHLSAQGAEVALERGALRVAVVHADDTRWVFRAGGYAVVVTGTVFDLRWEAPRGALTVAMHEGSVEVSGPSLAAPQRVVAGETVSFETPQHAAMAASSDPPAGAASALAKADPVAAPAPSVSAVPVAELSAAPASDSWQQLARDGHHKEAFAKVQPSFETLLQSSDASALALLANSARLSGHTPLARRAYAMLRQRFAGSLAAANAAFSLGTLSFGGDPATAANWLRTYLLEAPGGGFAAAARGRLLELALRSGRGSANANAAARDYLRYHPDGPHAAIARDALSSSAPAQP